MFPLYVSLLAGKFEKICTAFPLATFWTKNPKWLPLKFFQPKYINIPRAKKLKLKSEEDIFKLLDLIKFRNKSPRSILVFFKLLHEVTYRMKIFPTDSRLLHRTIWIKNLSREISPPLPLCNNSYQVLDWI